MADVGRPKGQPHTGGRRPGTKNKTQINDEMRRKILLCFNRVGGVRWLENFAREFPETFASKILPYVLPPLPRSEEAPGVAVQINQISDTEAAMRVAFLLNKSAYEQGLIKAPETKTIEPVAGVRESPAAEPELTLPPSQEPLPDNNPPLDCYMGSAAEQGRELPARRARRKSDLL